MNKVAKMMWEEINQTAMDDVWNCGVSIDDVINGSLDGDYGDIYLEYMDEVCTGIAQVLLGRDDWANILKEVGDDYSSLQKMFDAMMIANWYSNKDTWGFIPGVNE